MTTETDVEIPATTVHFETEDGIKGTKKSVVLTVVTIHHLKFYQIDF